MKHLTFFFALLSIGLATQAQFDERFYYPVKEWRVVPDSIDTEELTFYVEGDTLSSLLLKPKQDAKANVFFLHGSGGNVTTYLKMTIPLVEHGYRVLMIDFRGYGKSTGTPKHVNIAADAPLVFDALLKRAEFQGLPMIVYGASMGTQGATHLTTKRSEQIDLLILDGPMASFTDIALASAPEEQKAVIKQYVTSPYAAKEDVKKIKGTKLWVIMSEGDTAVPFEQSMLVYENGLAPKSKWEYEGEHLEAIQLYPAQFMEKLEKLLGEK